MKNVGGLKECYGCGICILSCPKDIIKLSLNDEGFYTPQIVDNDKCIECGACLKTCSYLADGLALKKDFIRSYAAWSNDMQIRRKCSSGGIGFELGKSLINKGYKVCGVRYNTEYQRAEHYIATTENDLIQSIGSKYIQSYTSDAFKSISKSERYLITGTPCQIDSMRRYLKRTKCEENFVLLDFFCHGVPSMLVWNKYCKWAEEIVGPITYVSWRNKHTGWHDSWAMGIDGEDHGDNINWHDSYNVLMREKKSYLQSRLSKGDMFYYLFLTDCCLGKQCYEHCKYKYDQSSADIRIGDLWGSAYLNDENGVSAVVTFTEKGDWLLKQLNCTVVEHDIDVVTEGQTIEILKKPSVYDKIMKSLKDEKLPLEATVRIVSNYKRCKRIQYLITHPHYTVSKLIGRLLSKKR